MDGWVDINYQMYVRVKLLIYMKRQLNTKKAPYAFWNILIGLYIYALHALCLEDKARGHRPLCLTLHAKDLATDLARLKIDRCLTSHGMGFLIE